MNWFRSAFVVGALVATVALLLPGGIRAEEQNLKEGKPKRRSFTGEVIAVNPDKKSFTLKNRKGEERTFFCSEKCRIVLEDKEAATLADLKVGIRLTSSYTEEGDVNVCHRLTPPKSKAKPKQPAE
ncbi:MAG: hypothetical protein RMM51_11190 [Verrucomicrobiae bacterium]|nr:hypothetical protein [Verrucomicrobiae bacterium]